MTCEEKRIQNNWTQKQYQECVQKNLPDLSEANEKAKEFNEDKEQGKIAGLVEKGIDKIPVMIGMFQKEVADRICSLHGSKQYGILSVLGQAYFSAKTLFYVEPDSFYPPPKVRSSVIILERIKTEIEVPYSDLHRVVKMAFNHRRKTIKNSLGLLISAIPNFDHPFLKLRPEQLSVQDFIDLTKALYNTPN